MVDSLQKLSGTDHRCELFDPRAMVRRLTEFPDLEDSMYQRGG
jgi:hypothetical protein